MRIGFFTDRYFPLIDGVSVSIEIFRTELEKLGHQVYIFCPAGAKKNLFEPERIIRFRSYPSFWYQNHRETIPWTPSNVTKIRKLKLDIVHVHTPAQIGLLGNRIALIENLPLISTHHTDIEKYAKFYRGIIAGIIAGALLGPSITKKPGLIKETLPILKPERSFHLWNTKIIRRALTIYYNNSDLVIAPSEKMYQQLINYGVKSRIIILPTGTEEKVTTNSSFDFRKKFKIGSQDKVLLFVGRLGEEKNIQLLIKALYLVKKYYLPTKLVIVGDGPYKKELIKLVKNLALTDSVFFTGMISHPETLCCYQDSDIFIFPSLTDTQGIVLNEAAYYNLPIIYLDNQISEITVDKVSALRCQNNKQDLAKKIIFLINNPNKAKALARNARKLALKYSAQSQAKKLENQYYKLKKDYNNIKL